MPAKADCNRAGLTSIPVFPANEVAVMAWIDEVAYDVLA
jgi:hypothetical protein